MSGGSLHRRLDRLNTTLRERRRAAEPEGIETIYDALRRGSLQLQGPSAGTPTTPEPVFSDAEWERLKATIAAYQTHCTVDE